MASKAETEDAAWQRPSQPLTSHVPWSPVVLKARTRWGHWAEGSSGLQTPVCRSSQSAHLGQTSVTEAEKGWLSSPLRQVSGFSYPEVEVAKPPSPSGFQTRI